jgi:16S rRNA C1402 (ribose-2'-O) methylase RsmI
VIFKEQGFQASGNVDENTAVAAGKLTGANFLFTGNLSQGSGSRRLFLRMLNAQTGQIVTNAVENL